MTTAARMIEPTHIDILATRAMMSFQRAGLNGTVRADMIEPGNAEFKCTLESIFTLQALANAPADRISAYVQARADINARNISNMISATIGYRSIDPLAKKHGVERLSPEAALRLI